MTKRKFRSKLRFKRIHLIKGKRLKINTPAPRFRESHGKGLLFTGYIYM